MNKKVLPSARREGLLVEELDRELLIYDLQSHKAHCLNESAGLIWKHCDGRTTVGEVKGVLKHRFGSDVDDDLIGYTIGKLGRARLLEGDEGTLNPTAGLSRRELVKRIGLGAALLVPAVTSLVAPEAVQAASCIPNGQACVVGGIPCCKGECRETGGAGYKCVGNA